MSDTVSEKILRCELCNKPFDKQSTLKRHGYYCRSQKQPKSSARLRSCVLCVKAKARCDNKFPSCKRCSEKNTECRYAISKHKPSLEQHARDQTRTVQLIDQEFSHIALPGAIQFSTGFDSRVAENEPLDLNFGIFDDNSFSWDLSTVVGSNSQDPGADENQVQPSFEDSTNLILFGQSGLFDQGIQVAQKATPMMPCIPYMPDFTLRSFEHLFVTDGASKKTSMLIVRLLTSYPAMMRKHNSLPPFIHPYFLTNVNNPDIKALESFNTCVSLMQITNTEPRGGRKLLWRNIRLECERLQEEWVTHDRWELLSSMQALLIYILIRLQEGETEHNNVDVLLLATVKTIAYALYELVGYIPCDQPVGHNTSASWKDWVFEESRRRLALIFRVMGLVFSMAPVNKCQLPSGFILSPLPAKKQLWEAPSEESWNECKICDPNLLKSFGVLSNGNMVELDEYRTLPGGEIVLSDPGRERADNGENWQEWCSGMDGLGSLVMLVTSLPW
ncbi:hypothetical protein B0J11DRAFT_238050 [Dendryphion nanum]|uniref:Zn(2)-C6 fungal-type domain-containing protein n=1 Tax=Dendryphion nanum TaxID=256645 RepID=A0A9P9CYA1_9PLEO|nr:hypothetical protein B0J11DRAFT_238050 [Dendryphion nanum]